MNNNIAIEYDENIISKIKEMIEEGWKKIINFFKLQNKGLDQNPNFDFYQELTGKLNKISIELEELNLFDELKYFLSISHMVKYIVYENSSDSSFGHCCFAVDLLKFFLYLFKTNLNYYNGQIEYETFQDVQKEFKRKHFEYKREFYWNIYQIDEAFNRDKMYDVAKSLR